MEDSYRRCRTSYINPMSRRRAWIAAYIAAGPITGPLLAGIKRHWRTAPCLATLYALAVVLTWIDLPLIAHALLRIA